MRRTFLKHAHFYTRRVISPPKPFTSPRIFRLFSSENDNNNNENDRPISESALIQSQPSNLPSTVEDIETKELKGRIQKYLEGDEEALPSIIEAILHRRMSGKHEDTDDELMEKLRMTPLDDVTDREFESDFDEIYETDEEIDNLYNTREYVEKKMAQDEYFNMDDQKWDEMIKEATEKGFLKDTGECERILEDMLRWDNLLPDEIKEKVEAKFNELGDMCERGEIEPEKAYELFKEFEDKMVLECGEMMAAEQPPEDDEISEASKKKHLDDPPGEGPILRWQTRVVFAPGGDAWHPKNRKVKLSVTVKELGLSKHAFRRLREVVGKRYHPGRDELTITSERFEHREENRKDCLRTLYSLIEDAGKANKLVEETRASFVKERLKANPSFMERLRAKAATMQGSNIVSPS
ncbi:uncharacterized protein LOC131234331 [Magnolia sinica]|uniref:uncharacterized protein LOC131234331 n=1 Tax=Magnolia sinica TaxID=86752 RepID=UPI00265965FE|nr:uncharacterized protein LOC131234331 [Magnolia sinica]